MTEAGRSLSLVCTVHGVFLLRAVRSYKVNNQNNKASPQVFADAGIELYASVLTAATAVCTGRPFGRAHLRSDFSVAEMEQ